MAAIFVVLRALVFQPFNIPSGSMKRRCWSATHSSCPKFSYGYQPLFAAVRADPVLWPHPRLEPPERGDIVVFRAQIDDEMRDFIKRIIGLPGDRIQMIGGHLHINGAPFRASALPTSSDRTRAAPTAPPPPRKRWRETLPNGVRYETLDCLENGPLDDTPVFTVPAGHYFMMGDNRDDSLDSRVPAPDGFGAMPFENLLGRAQFVFFSVGEGERAWTVWRWPWSVRWARLFTVVR